MNMTCKVCGGKQFFTRTVTDKKTKVVTRTVICAGCKTPATEAQKVNDSPIATKIVTGGEKNV